MTPAALHRAACLSRDVYDGGPEGWMHIEDRETDTQCAVSTIAGRGEVVFRGTDGRRDLRTDLRARLVPFRLQPRMEGHVHAGVRDAWLGVRASVIYPLITQRCSRVQLTGHSLGGMLALYAGLDIAWTLQVPVSVISFGAAHTVDRRGSAACAAMLTHTRVVHGCDPVPHLLDWSWRYRHDVPATRIGAHPLAATLRALLLPFRLIIHDHAMARYVAALAPTETGP